MFNRYERVEEMKRNFLFFTKGGMGYFLAAFFLFFLLGIEVLLFMNIRYVDSKINSSIEVKIPMVNSITKDELDHIASAIKEVEGTKNLRFTSKEDGLNEVLHALEAEFLSTETLKDTNPLLPMYTVRVNDPKVIDSIKAKLDKQASVIEVVYGEKFIKKWLSFMKLIQPILIVLFIAEFTLAAYLIQKWCNYLYDSQDTILAAVDMTNPTTYLKKGYQVFVPVILLVSFTVIILYNLFYEIFEESVELSVVSLPEPFLLSVGLLATIIVAGMASLTAGWGMFVRNKKSLLVKA